MLAIGIVWRLVPRVRPIVSLVASVPEYLLQLGDVTSVTLTHTHRQTLSTLKYWCVYENYTPLNLFVKCL